MTINELVSNLKNQIKCLTHRQSYFNSNADWYIQGKLDAFEEVLNMINDKG